MFEAHRELLIVREQLDTCNRRVRDLEETLRKAYVALKKHEEYDIDIVGEAMSILDEKAWG
jgi:hypothetical protein